MHFNMIGYIVRSRDGELLAMASIEANLYQGELKKVIRTKVSNLAYTSSNGHIMEFWHKRLGNLHAKSLKALLHMVSDMNLDKFSSNVIPFACERCVEGKQAKQPFYIDGGSWANKVLELVHSVMCRPTKDHVHGWNKVLSHFY